MNSVTGLCIKTQCRHLAVIKMLLCFLFWFARLSYSCERDTSGTCGVNFITSGTNFPLDEER